MLAGFFSNPAWVAFCAVCILIGGAAGFYLGRLYLRRRDEAARMKPTVDQQGPAPVAPRFVRPLQWRSYDNEPWLMPERGDVTVLYNPWSVK